MIPIGILSGKGEAQVLELEIPVFPFIPPPKPMNTTKTKLLIKPARQKKPDSYFFPQWAPLEGYAATLTYHREPGVNQQGKFEPGSLIIGSLSPTGGRKRPTFWGLVFSWLRRRKKFV